MVDQAKIVAGCVSLKEAASRHAVAQHSGSPRQAACRGGWSKVTTSESAAWIASKMTVWTR